MNEALADSNEVEITEPVEQESTDNEMSEAMESIANDLFPRRESEEEEVEEIEEIEEAEEVEEIEAEAEESKPEPRKAPNSWKKEMHEMYAKLDPAVQDYIDHRENQMREGLEKDRADANLGRTMRDMMKPHQALFDQAGLQGPEAVQRLLQAHHTLTSANPQQRAQYMQQLAKSYGVSLNGEPVKENEEVNNLNQRLSQIEKNLTASHQRALQAERARIDAEINTFAETHPLLDELSDDIAMLISAGNLSLEEAYEKAVWSNPVTRQKEIEQIEAKRQKEAEKLAKQEAEEAKKAKAVNVKAKNTRKAPTRSRGKFLDTESMLETLREIESRRP